MKWNDLLSPLTELFDTRPELPDETNISDEAIEYYFTVDGVRYGVWFEQSTEGHYWLSYGYVNEEEQDLDFTPNSKTENPNPPQNARKVLSYVIGYTEQFLKKYKPLNVEFSGSKTDGLSSVYNKMIPILKPRLSSLGYYIDSYDARSTSTNFVITKK